MIDPKTFIIYQLTNGAATITRCNGKVISNLQKRINDFRKRSVGILVSEPTLYTYGMYLLPIIDNLERAANYSDGEKVKEGVILTAKTVGGVLDKLKVEPIGAVGDIFDPKLHHAVLHEEDPERAEGEIVDVFQKGYKKGNKIIRFAMVKTVN